MKRSAIVAGATGLIGRALVQLLLEEPAYESVTALVRRSTGINHPKLRERLVDYNDLAHADIDWTGADVYCALGTTIKKAGSRQAFRQVDYEYPLALGRVAAAAGASQLLLVSSIGANSASRNFYLRVKGEVEEALRSLDFPALHLFRPSLLLGKREEFRLGERLASVVAPLFAGLMGKYRPVEARVVAEAMIRAALRELSGVHVHVGINRKTI